MFGKHDLIIQSLKRCWWANPLGSSSGPSGSANCSQKKLCSWPYQFQSREQRPTKHPSITGVTSGHVFEINRVEDPNAAHSIFI